MADCPLCEPEAERVVWRGDFCRVITVPQPGYAGFCRVVWHRHVREMTDLTPSERDHFMGVVWAVEAAQREVLKPIKINLASLGNQVPHLHWHVIPRYVDDPHFPDAVWAPPRRNAGMSERDDAALAEGVVAKINAIGGQAG